MTADERIDHITTVGLEIAAHLNSRVAGPKDAIGALAVAMARVLCEFPKDEWGEVFDNLEDLARTAQPTLDSYLVRAKQS